MKVACAEAAIALLRQSRLRIPNVLGEPPDVESEFNLVGWC